MAASGSKKEGDNMPIKAFNKCSFVLERVLFPHILNVIHEIYVDFDKFCSAFSFQIFLKGISITKNPQLLFFVKDAKLRNFFFFFSLSFTFFFFLLSFVCSYL